MYSVMYSEVINFVPKFDKPCTINNKHGANTSKMIIHAQRVRIKNIFVEPNLDTLNLIQKL